MTNRKYQLFTIISTLTLLVILTFVLIVAFTFGGSYQSPDVVVTYKRNKLTWSAPVEKDTGIASINIFGDPEEGEEHPLIDPTSSGVYYLQLFNAVRRGPVNYTLYLYCDNEIGVPLDFKVTRKQGMTDVDQVPESIAGKEILDMVSGTVDKYSSDVFEIKWHWATESDEKDTEVGNKAAAADSYYTFRLMIVIEDNNSYTWGDGEGTARMLHRAYVKGYPQGDFRPEGNMTRAETAAIFARILANYDETKLKTEENGFNDVPFGQWYTKYVARVEYSQVVNGYPDGSYRPDGFITRAEFAAVCVRYFESRTETLQKAELSFTDFDSSHWSYEIVQKAVHQGFVNGYPDGTFKPDDYITRAEVVTVVNRMLDRSADVEFINNNFSELTHFTDLNDKNYWAFYEIYEAANNHHARGITREIWLDLLKPVGMTKN